MLDRIIHSLHGTSNRAISNIKWGGSLPLGIPEIHMQECCFWTPCSPTFSPSWVCWQLLAWATVYKRLELLVNPAYWRSLFYLNLLFYMSRMDNLIRRTSIVDQACLHYLEKHFVLQFLLPHGWNLMESVRLHLLLRGHHQR